MDDEELAELLFSFLLDDDYEGSDSQTGAAFYIAKLNREVLKKKKDKLLMPSASKISLSHSFVFAFTRLVVVALVYSFLITPVSLKERYSGIIKKCFARESLPEHLSQ